MRPILTIRQSAVHLLLSKASFYRLVADGLLPPPIKVSANRSGVFEDEINAVIEARASGEDDEAIRALVAKIIKQRNTPNHSNV